MWKISLWTMNHTLKTCVKKEVVKPSVCRDPWKEDKEEFIGEINSYEKV